MCVNFNSLFCFGNHWYSKYFFTKYYFCDFEKNIEIIVLNDFIKRNQRNILYKMSLKKS